MTTGANIDAVGDQVVDPEGHAGIDDVLAYQHAAGADAGAVGDSHGRMNQDCRLPSMGPDPVRKTSSRDAVSDGDNGLEWPDEWLFVQQRCPAQDLTAVDAGFDRINIVEKARNRHVQKPSELEHGTPVRTGTDDQEWTSRHVRFPILRFSLPRRRVASITRR